MPLGACSRVSQRVSFAPFPCMTPPRWGKRLGWNQGTFMAKLDIHTGIHWMACELIEQIPGKVSGRPIVRGTRIMPGGIVNSHDIGESIEDIHEDWPSLSLA